MPQEPQQNPYGSFISAALRGELDGVFDSVPSSHPFWYASRCRSEVRMDEARLSAGGELGRAREVLRRSLSVRSNVSTPARGKNSRAVDEPTEYRVIGLGTCGTVFEVPWTDFAVKKGRDVEAMRNDFLLTDRVHDAIADTRGLLQDTFPERTIPKAPRCSGFWMPEERKYWEVNLDRFPAAYREIGAVMKVDRILPLPQAAREALIDLYFEDCKDVREAAKTDEENEHCLVRIYLGERETEEQEAGCYDSLRNFPMRLNMIEDLGLEKSVLATEMAIALAVIHWQAQVDAMDVEYVLGSAPAMSSNRRRVPTTRDSTRVAPDPGVLPRLLLPAPLLTEPCEVHGLNFTTRPVHMWVLDFDKASSIQLTPNDVDKKLVPAFLGNDPYYPRPDVDEELWEIFNSVYLRASSLILDNRKERGRAMRLPKRFVTKVAATIKAHESWNPEEHIVFGD